jgi:cellulose synthase/poly-beta-1,6-N-acetylglucosamine synthase-like glycosyltransferase
MPHLSKNSQGVPLKHIPLVSIIIPTRNESKRINNCIETLKSQTYPKLEIIVIDDSTDNTKDVIKGIVGNDKRFKIIKQKKLPSGWVGKPFAVQQGSSIAQGEWLIFIDADTFYHPVLVERVVEFAQRNKLDMVSLAPQHICKSFWEKMIQPIFLGAILGLSPLAKVNDPSSKVSFASGPFIMINHAVFDSVGGYRTIKGFIADDIEIAKLVKSSGFKLGIVNAQSLMSLRMYEKFHDIWEGWSKNSFLGFVQKREVKSKFLQILIFIIVSFLIFDFLILPFATFISALFILLFLRSLPSIYLLLFPLITWIVSVFALLYVQRVYHIDRAWYSPLTLALGGIITMGIFANSAIKTVSGRGVIWKGKLYAIEK